MHDDGLAEDVGKATICNGMEARQDGLRKIHRRSPPPRPGQESFRRIKAFCRIAAGVEPSRLTAAAAPDLCRRAGNEKLTDDGVQVRWWWLCVPFVGKSLCIA